MKVTKIENLSLVRDIKPPILFSPNFSQFDHLKKKTDFSLVQNREWKKKLFWTNKEFIFFFNCSSWEKLVGKIGQNTIGCFVDWCHELQYLSTNNNTIQHSITKRRKVSKWSQQVLVKCFFFRLYPNNALVSVTILLLWSIFGITKGIQFIINVMFILRNNFCMKRTFYQQSGPTLYIALKTHCRA